MLTRKTEILTLLFIDILMLVSAWVLYFQFRVHSDLFTTPFEDEFWAPMVIIGLFWLILFAFMGLYRSRYAASRFDELVSIFKSVTMGAIILFFAIFVDDARTDDPSNQRLLIIVYWLTLLTTTGFGRLLYRTIIKRLTLTGVVSRISVIVGTYEKSRELYDMILQFPLLGLKVAGYINVGPVTVETRVPRLGSVENLEEVLEELGVQEVLVALPSTEHDQLLDIIGKCSVGNVNIKILPDMYDIISGQARTNQLYGIPLIEITPQLMQPWERVIKRLMDLTVSLFVLVAGLPVWLLVALAIKLTSHGPVFYQQDRVGKKGRVFHILKYRSMYEDAEKHSGPRWADKDDPRVTPTGKFLRKTHLDEVPQFINILEGSMSLIGPRPERPFFVEQFIREIPLYRRRLNVRPGLTGWAQVKHRYDASVEDVRTKLRFDLFYIENMSLRMDVKILIHTFFRIITAKGQA